MRIIKFLILIITIILIYQFYVYANVDHTDQQYDMRHAKVANFGVGCFWTAQSIFDKVNGVIKTVVGYSGGYVAYPSYEQVSQGGSGHYEVIQIFYDPKKVSYQSLLDKFWHNIDPTDASGQFCDKGDQYRAVIFYQDEAEKNLAEASKKEMLRSSNFSNITTQILPAKKFFPAEEYHQKFYLKNPLRYQFYRYMCGRDARLHELKLK